MRVLFVTRQLAPHGVGGIGTYVATVGRMMRHAGHDVTVLAVAEGAERSSEVRDGYRIEWFPPVGPDRLWAALERRWFQPAVGLRAALGARRALRRLDGRFDAIEAPDWKSEGLFLAGARKGPVVIHLHLARELVRLWSRLPAGRSQRAAEWLERRSVRRAAAVTAASTISALRPDRTPWLPGVEVTIVPPPMDLDEWGDVPPVEATEPVVVLAGHLEQRKAPDLLLAAVARIQAEDPVPGLRVVFAGRAHGGPGGVRYDEWLRTESARLGVACEVLPLQEPSAMRALYARARVVAVPSRFETLSMVVLEAFLAGRPVVLTDAVGAAEWVGAAVPDLVAPSEDVAALAAALRPLLGDAGAARRAADAGRQAVIDACAPAAIVDRRVAVYRRVAAVARGRRRR